MSEVGELGSITASTDDEEYDTLEVSDIVLPPITKYMSRPSGAHYRQSSTSVSNIVPALSISDYINHHKANSKHLLPTQHHMVSPSGSWLGPRLSVVSNSSCPTIFAVDVPTRYELEDFGCTLEKKRTCRSSSSSITLLDHVDLQVHGGEILAIMGPSGAGKSILMECATLHEPKHVTVTGKVMINNVQMTTDLFKEHCYIVHQSEYLAPWLKCRETLIYAAMNCIDDLDRIHTHIQDLMECLGLEGCADVYVGNEFQRGLSGGQQRRLSVCLALVKMPKFIFLDEPTSGLDSASALWTCSYLRKVAVKYGIGVIMTIHQPNTKIFDTFSTLLLLHKGQVVYYGAANGAENFFNKQGYKLPPKTNMTDYFFDILQKDNFKNNFHQEKLRIKSKLSKIHRQAMSLDTDGVDYLHLPASRRRPSLLKQTYWAMRRDMVIMYRDPMLYTGRCGAFAIMSIFFALVYIDTGNKNQEQILPSLWLQGWLLCCPCCMACIIIFKHCQDTISLTRNIRNGIQHPLPYLVARLLQVPMMFLLSICSLSVAGYAICGWAKEKYINVITAHALTLLAFELTAEFCALWSQNFAISMLLFIGFWFASFLFCGLVVRDVNVMWPIRILCKILPLRYGQKAIAYEEFIGREFSGAQYCDPDRDTHCHNGFKCSGSSCLGITGTEVLDSLIQVFDLYSSDEDTTIKSVFILLIFCAAVKLMYILRVLWIVKYE